MTSTMATGIPDPASGSKKENIMSLQFTYLHADAHRAGMAALNAAAPRPMVVRGQAQTEAVVA